MIIRHSTPTTDASIVSSGVTWSDYEEWEDWGPCTGAIPECAGSGKGYRSRDCTGTGCSNRIQTTTLGNLSTNTGYNFNLTSLLSNDKQVSVTKRKD